MSDNQGIENLKKQVYDFLSLKKEIGRKEFALYGTISLIVYLFIIELSYSPSGPGGGWLGLFFYFLFTTTPLVFFMIFSAQRLNSLKLSRNIVWIFILTFFWWMLGFVVRPSFSYYEYSMDSHPYYYAMYNFLSDLYFSQLGYLYIYLFSVFIMCFIFAVIYILLLFIKGINK